MKKLLSLLLVLTLVFSTVLALASCSVTINPFWPVTKDSLTKNVNQEEDTSLSKVSDFLKHWRMPSFDATHLDAIETAASVRYYQNGVTAQTVARAMSNRFIEEYYDNIDRSDKELVTLTYNKLYCEALSSLSVTPLTDEELLAATQTAPADYGYAAQFLLAWGMPSFYAFKLLEVEDRFFSSFYDSEKMPTAYKLAKGIVESYAAADKSAITSISELTDGVIRAYVLGVGDKYAAYRTVEEYEEYDDNMSGNYVGIGVVVEYSYADNTLTVTGFPEGSPAEEAGVLLGDILFAVDGEEAKTLGYDATIAKARGEVDTEVTVTIQRGEELLDFTIVRKNLPDNTVSYSLTDNVAIIRISRFKANTGDLFKTAIDKAEADGAKAIVFDVRSNPGGYLDSVVEALSYLVPEGTRIATFGASGYDEIDAYDDHSVSVPCAVLCNGYTASAGELFTAALRDFGTPEFGLLDVTVIGTETYKKGVMQNTYVLSDESTLTLTVSYYNPPSGVNYDGIGITPDVILELDSEEDNQKAYALNLMKEKIAEPKE